MHNCFSSHLKAQSSSFERVQLCLKRALTHRSHRFPLCSGPRAVPCQARKSPCAVIRSGSHSKPLLLATWIHQGRPAFDQKSPIDGHHDEHWPCRLSPPPTTRPFGPWVWQPSRRAFLPTFFPSTTVLTASILCSDASSSRSAQLPAVPATELGVWKLQSSIESISRPFNVIW